METRIFGRSNHKSSVAIFGAAALWSVKQSEADETMELILERGVNHIDVAPSYGTAEERLGPWMTHTRERFFLGCKTMQRDREGAAQELHQSLKRLRVDHFDLYQIHAIEKLSDLDLVTSPGGALEALIEAKESGLTRYIGITGHGVDVPSIFIEALERFDFDSVLFPINFIQYKNPLFQKNAGELLRICKEKNIGTMIIKSIAKGRWEDDPKINTTWYKPFTDWDHIQKAVDFVLSQEVTGLCTPGDIQLLPLVLDACEQFTPLSQAAQQELIDSAEEFEPLFV